MKERIEILREVNLIDEKIEKALYDVIRILKTNWDLELTEEQGGMMITHLGRACMRVKSGEDVGEMDTEVAKELRESDNFEKVKRMYEDIEKKLLLTLPDVEREYMYANLLFLLEE